MKLITKNLAAKIPPLYGQDGKGMDATAYVKLFTPWAGWTWWITEYDPETRNCFGLVQGMETELGYFNLSELETIKGPMGLCIERDTWFEPQSLQEVVPS